MINIYINILSKVHYQSFKLSLVSSRLSNSLNTFSNPKLIKVCHSDPKLPWPIQDPMWCSRACHTKVDLLSLSFFSLFLHFLLPIMCVWERTEGKHTGEGKKKKIWNRNVHVACHPMPCKIPEGRGNFGIGMTL